MRELRRFPELECTFRHGLLQEAALSTLTPTSMRELYGRVGHAMEERYADQLEESLERLAFYFYRSAEPEIAVGYLERAAERAVGLEAFERGREPVDQGAPARGAGRRRGGDRERFDARLAELASRAAGSA